MADGKTKAKNPRFFAFDAIDLNTYLAKKGVLGNVEEMGRFFQSMLNDLLSGCVRDGCDEFVKGEIFGHAEERMLTKRKRNQEYYQKRKNGIPNAEPAPLVDDTENEERKPYGTKKNVWLSDFELQSLRDTFPTIDKKEFRIAVDTVSQRYSGRFDVPARDGWLSVMNRELDRMRIDKESRENAQAKLSAAKMYKDIQDAKPKPFQ